MRLSRRHFVSLAAASAGFVCVPGSAQAVMALPFRPKDLWPLLEEADAKTLQRLEGKRLTLTGYLSRDEQGTVLSHLPRHCDYCYLGSPRSMLRVKGVAALRLSNDKVSIKGILYQEENQLTLLAGTSQYNML